MVQLTATTINAGDPVTSEAINKIIEDLALINKSTTSTFSLNLASAGVGQGGTGVSQKVYSTTFKVDVKASSAGGSGATWTFDKDTFKKTPMCWVQARSSNTKLTPAQLNFTVLITSVTAKSMTFKVRGPGGKLQTDATIDFDCFAIEG